VFTREDLGLLRAAAAALALVVSRSHAFETIRTMNVALEETVRVRTQELEATRVELYQREKMSSLALLAAGVAHELNTPLGVVSSTAEQLAASLSDGGDARLARLASLCREASTRASDIVSNLRDFSRPGERYLEWGDLRSLVDSTLRVAGSLLRDHRIAVAVDLPAFPKVLCHPALLNQVLMNLVMNAVEAMGRDGALTITGSVEGDTVRLALDDTGPGVDVAVRKRIFEPFFTTKGQGTGLGLALCFGIVEMHRGRIWVETGARGGARFVVELPRDARPRP
jgi:signal transduction histidine kinase